MADFHGAEHLNSAIRYLQERILIFVLMVTFVAVGAAFWSLGTTSARMAAHDEEIRRMKDEIAVYEIYIQRLHADLSARGFEPPELQKEKPE